MTMQFMDPFLFKNPFICGPTGSSKSTFVMRLLKNITEMLSEKVKKIYYFYNNWQKNFDQQNNGNIEFRQGLPSEEDFKRFPNSEHSILVIDDLKIPALNNIFIANLFSRELHHRNISVMLILQNLFH